MVWPLIIGGLLAASGEAEQAMGAQQAARAMAQAVADERQRQLAISARLKNEVVGTTDTLGVPGQVAASQAAAGPLAAQTNTATSDVAAAFGKANQGGSAALRGAINQGTTGAVQRAQATGQDAATLYGVNAGFESQGRKLQQLALDRSRLANESASSLAVLPLEEQAASQKGAVTRSLGNLSSQAGQQLMMYDLWKPQAGSSGDPGQTPVTSSSRIVAPDRPVAATSAGLWA